MKLFGQKANFLGDSITYGYGTSGPDRIYLNLVKEHCGLAEARNYGIGGNRIARQAAGEQYGECFAVRFREMDGDADLVVVLGGTNDYDHGDAPLGKYGDTAETTFYGACHALMRGLIAQYPAAQIVIMTPLHREYEETTKPQGGPLSAYVRAILETAGHFSLPVLDLYHCAGIDPSVPEQRALLTIDGLHPNDSGHERIAARLEGFLRQL